MDTAQDLFKHELRDVYDAEHRQVKALSKMAGEVSDSKLAEALREHQEETEQQIRRLDGVFKAIGEKPQRETCPGIIGLIKEFEKFVEEEDPGDEVLNVFTTESALKAEHYEVVSYSGLIKLAGQMGQRTVVDLLQENLDEELATAQNLEILSEQLGEELSLQG